MCSNIKIVSGGQTGVDRGALDAALEMEIDAGGWCPENRRAEDGVIADTYPVIALQGSGYRQRTKKNVLDSDATLIIYKGEVSGGTELTLSFCIKHHKKYLLIDAEMMDEQQAADRFVKLHANLTYIKVKVVAILYYLARRK